MPLAISYYLGLGASLLWDVVLNFFYWDTTLSLIYNIIGDLKVLTLSSPRMVAQIVLLAVGSRQLQCHSVHFNWW